MSQSQAYQAYLPERCKQCGHFPGFAGVVALPPRCKRCRDLPGLAQAALLYAKENSPHPQPELAPQAQSILNETELRILHHLSNGRRQKEIVLEESMSLPNVKYYYRRVCEKLEVTSTGQAVAEALRRGIIP